MSFDLALAMLGGPSLAEESRQLRAPPSQTLQAGLGHGGNLVDDGAVTGGVGIGLLPPQAEGCLLYTSPSPRDRQKSRMPSSA